MNNYAIRTVLQPPTRVFLSQNCPNFPRASLPTPAEFTDKIRTEFIAGSAIAPSLFAVTVEVTPDLVEQPGGEVETPIHNALNWQYTRFGYQARPTLYGAILRNEDGACWQVKLSAPVQDQQKGKLRKYETPAGNGSRAFLPAIDVGTWKKIATRHELPLEGPWLKVLEPRNQELTKTLNEPSLSAEARPNSTQNPAGVNLSHYNEWAKLSLAELKSSIEGLPNQAIVPSFWSYVESIPTLPIIFTEGGKKGLSLLSLGYIAIATYGVNGGYRKREDGSRYLIDDISRFTGDNRPITLAFDQDSRDKTRRQVSTALSRFGTLLEAAGAAVSVASWNGQDGKGVDDLIVNAGAANWDAAYQAALPLSHWRIHQRLAGRLTWQPALRLNVADLSTLETKNLPTTGIIAIASPKGTGKTKFTAQQIKDTQKALVAGHRIALMRQLGERLGCNYLGDIDKAQGQFIVGGAYTLRISFCVDSLLAIDPAQFVGCDLVIDEVTQVLRHLLTSSTCAKNGKRPALLARLRELLHHACRVFVADADLDNATLHYLQELRGDQTPVFLIRNDYQPVGYNVRFIESDDYSPILEALLASVRTLRPKQVEYVATDSKRLTKALTKLIQHQSPGVEVLVLNSETIGGEAETQFNYNPDQWLAKAKQQDKPLVIVASPTLATGTSIESQGFQHVWGIFTGVSSTDADMAQALGRVREPVERIIWCAKRGSNYSKISYSTNPLELKQHLMDKTSTTISLVRSGLREDIYGQVCSYDWTRDPHLNLYCQLEAARNRSMQEIQTALRVRLQFEGNHVIVEEKKRTEAVRSMLLEIKAGLKELDATAIVSAPILSIAEALALENQESISPEDRAALERFQICDFYNIPPDELTLDLVLQDKGGQLRAEIRSLEELLYPGVAIDRSVKALARQSTWNQGICPWDISDAELRRKLREAIRLPDFLNPEFTWTQLDLEPYAKRIRELGPSIKLVLRFTPSDKLSNTQVVHQLLRQLGLKLKMQWSRSIPGREGLKLRYFHLDLEQWQFLQEVIARRTARRTAEQTETAAADYGSPDFEKNKKPSGDPIALLKTPLSYGNQRLGEVAATTQEEQAIEARESIEASVQQFADYQENLKQTDWHLPHIPDLRE